MRGVAERGAFTLGEPVEGFEREFAAYCETDFAVGVSSGTEALALALRALEIGPGDEVIVPTNSFIATAEAVSAVGATPRLVDVDPDSHLITAEIVAANLGPRVRCVIPVHLFGATVEMDPILELATRGGRPRGRGRLPGARRALPRPARGHARRDRLLQLLPDQEPRRLGRRRRGRHLRPELAERVRLLRAHGERPRYHHRLVGTTARLDALQAAVLRRKLTRLDGWNDERRRLGAGAARADCRGSRTASAERRDRDRTSLRLRRSGDHVYHLFVVRSEQRDELREHLAECGVASAIHYPDADPPDRGLRRARARTRAACRSASGWPGASARCRCSRG